MSVTEYVIPLGENARKRHYHETDKGEVTGFAHLDRYYLDGRKVKEELHLNLGDALYLADEDIKENWKTYKMAFLEG